MENDRSYFTRRALEERSAADKADDPKAREAHQRMAERYEEQAQAADEQEPSPVFSGRHEELSQ